MAGPLQVYEVTQPDGTKARLKLTAEHAAELGAVPVGKPGSTPAATVEKLASMLDRAEKADTKPNKAKKAKNKAA